MKILAFFIYSSILFCQTETGTITGKVTDADCKCALPGAIVIIEGTSFGAASDSIGNYIITNVPFGKHILSCRIIGYPSKSDTIELTNTQTPIRKDFTLRFLKIPIEKNEEIKEYHKLFAGLESDQIMNLHIDSISDDYRYLTLTFRNKTIYNIYLIEDLFCFSTTSTILKNEKGELIPHNMINLGCDDQPYYLPQKNNLIKIKPFESITWLMQIDEYFLKDYKLPKGKYTLTAKYKIDDFKFLPGFFTQMDVIENNKFEDEIFVLNQATRGEYFSDNMIIIEK